MGWQDRFPARIRLRAVGRFVAGIGMRAPGDSYAGHRTETDLIDRSGPPSLPPFHGFRRLVGLLQRG